MTEEFQHETWDKEFAKQYKAMTREEKEAAFKDYLITRTFEGISKLSEETAETVLKHTSQACLKTALSQIIHFGYDPDKGDIDAFNAAAQKMENMLGEGTAHITRQGNIVDYVTASGRCVCPFVKYYKVVKPFPNQCLCAKNLIKTMYEVAHKGLVKADVIEAYNRGGNCCHFRIELL